MSLHSLQRELSDSAAPESSPQDLLRKSLGGFRLLRLLGTGGMAAVYLGHRAGPSGASEFSAIKVMLPHLIDDEASVHMFLDEARITSSIHHPYVCRVLDFGVDDGLPYLATEYVMGEVLSDLVEALHQTEEGKVASRALVAQIIAQACEGLHAAHEACDDQGNSLGIVHRDTAPQNIMVGYDGCVRVLDFGIARFSNQLHETQQGVFRGRFAYMAPEQMESGTIDRRADIWSLGVMLWEGVSGRRLFKRGNINRTMRAVIADPLKPLLHSVDDMPPALLDVVGRSVVRDAQARFRTAREMSIGLSRYASDGTPQIAAWMERLFEARLKEKRRELQEAAASVPSSFDGVSGYPVSIRPIITKSGIRLASDLQPPNSSSDALSPSEAPELSGLARAFRIASRVAVVLTVAAVVAAGLFSLDRLWSGAKDGSGKPSTFAHMGSLGIVVVRTSGDAAQVQIDGRALGLTPIQVALAPGRHEVRVSRDDHALPVWAPIDVQSGVVHSLDIPLDE